MNQQNKKNNRITMRSVVTVAKIKKMINVTDNHIRIFVFSSRKSVIS